MLTTDTFFVVSWTLYPTYLWSYFLVDMILAVSFWIIGCVVSVSVRFPYDSPESAVLTILCAFPQLLARLCHFQTWDFVISGFSLLLLLLPSCLSLSNTETPRGLGDRQLWELEKFCGYWCWLGLIFLYNRSILWVCICLISVLFILRMGMLNWFVFSFFYVYIPTCVCVCVHAYM